MILIVKSLIMSASIGDSLNVVSTVLTNRNNKIKV